MTVALPHSVDVSSSIPRRNGVGRFASVYVETVLLAAVPEVARNVARRFDKEPEAVTQAEWNTGRRAVQTVYGDLPLAHQVCLRLADRDGNSWPWRDLLAVTLDPNRDAKKTYEERLSEPDRTISLKRVGYAVKYIAGQLGCATLLPHEYEETRSELLAGPQGMLLRDVLPSRGQIETACGGWDEALQHAGLASRQSVTVGPSAERELPTKEAIVSFHADNGRYPNRDELDSYLRARSCTLPCDADTHWWSDLAAAEEAITYLHETGVLTSQGSARPTEPSRV